MKKLSKLFLFILSFVLVFSAVSCKKNKQYEYKYNKESENMLKFSSSDKNLDNFLNDFLRRHLSYDDERLYSIDLGQSSWFAKEWESMALNYFDVSENTLNSDRYEIMEGQFSSRVVDKYGYVWSGWHQLENPKKPQSGELFMQGWPFPYEGHSDGQIFEYEFNNEDWDVIDNAMNWQVYVDGENKNVDYQDGFISAEVSERRPASKIVFESPAFISPSFQSPFLELDFRMTDLTSLGIDSSVDDISVEWHVHGENQDAWHSAEQKKYHTRAMDKIPANYAQRMYFSMYQHEDWLGKDANGRYVPEKSKDIDKLRVVVNAKENKKFVGTAQINYLRMGYDTRQVNNQAILINAVKNMYEYNANDKLLLDNMGNLRRAMLFYLENLQGKDGLIDLKSLVGHDGIVNNGQGIGNGYWDVLVSPEVNLYSNIYFYSALQSMAYLESMVEQGKLEVIKPTVKGFDNVSDFTYSYTSKNLYDLAKTVKANIEKDVSSGGFWNANTGRFVLGINPDAMSASDADKYYDYGFVQFNLETLARGIGSAEQKKSVMDWISGKRIVDGDTAKSYNDIYKYEFAPITNTLDNQSSYYWPWTPYAFGEQIMNGGSVLYLTYYDMVSRNDVYGVDNVYDRMKSVQSWYDKVSSAGGKGESFYKTYYDKTDYTLEGWVGGGGNGTLGIDTVFQESATLTSSIKDTIFGMKGLNYNTMSFTPSLPSKLDFFKMENVIYKGAKYDVSVGKNFFRIDSVKSKVDNTFIQVSLSKPSKKFTVEINGVATNDYTVVDGRIVVTIPFANGVVTIK